MGDFLLPKEKKLKIDFFILLFLLILTIFSLVKFIFLINDISFSARQIKKIILKANSFIYKDNKYFIKIFIKNDSNFPIFLTYYEFLYKVIFKDGSNYNNRIRNSNIYFIVDSMKEDYILIELNDLSKLSNIEEIQIRGNISVETNPSVSKYKILFNIRENLKIEY